MYITIKFDHYQFVVIAPLFIDKNIINNNTTNDCFIIIQNSFYNTKLVESKTEVQGFNN